MKLMKLFAVFMLLGMSSAAFGHGFTFNNKSGKTVQVTARGQWALSSEKATLQPGGTHTFYSAMPLKTVDVGGTLFKEDDLKPLGNTGYNLAKNPNLSFDITSGWFGFNLSKSPSKGEL